MRNHTLTLASNRARPSDQKAQRLERHWLKISTAAVPLWIICSVTGLADEPAANTSSYYSIRGTVYSKPLANNEEHGFGADLSVRLSAAVYRYRSVDDLFDPDTRHIQSLGIRPSIGLIYPTRWRHVSFKPALEVSVVRQRDLNRTLVSGAVSVALAYDNRKEKRLRGSATVKYGTRYDEDGLNLDDYLKFTLRTSLRRGLDWTIGTSQATVTPFVSASYFLDELDLGVRQGFYESISEQYEIGITFGTFPRLRFWKVKLPEIDVSFTYGDDLKGIKIRF